MLKNRIAIALKVIVENRNYIAHAHTNKEYTSIQIMHKEGISYAKIYWYDDDESTVYFEGLSVKDEYRKHGYGLKMHEMLESISRAIGGKYSCFWTDENDWMKTWYERMGYSVTNTKEDQEGFVWMLKQL